VIASSTPAPFRAWSIKRKFFTRRLSDHFRNRLTHTIESLADHAHRSRPPSLLTSISPKRWPWCTILGHPPFGHAGKGTPTLPCGEHNLFFDHNLHAPAHRRGFRASLRRFSRPEPYLSEVREGIIKHSARYDPAQHPELAEYLLDQRLPSKPSSST